MPDATELTQRQRQVAELVAQRITTKRIAGLLGIKRRRVQAIIRGLALAIGASPEEDDRQAVADWWRQQSHEHPHQQDAA